MSVTMNGLVEAPTAPAPIPTAPAIPPAASGPPVAEIHVVKTTYHGVTIADPYRWLEGDSSNVKAWSDSPNPYPHATLAHLPTVE